MRSLPSALAQGAGDGLGYVEGLAPSEIHRRLQRCARLGDVGAWGLARYLLEVHERGLFQSWGASDVQDYAEAHFDLSPRRTRELLRAARRLRHLPELEKAFCDQTLSWTKVLLLLRVLTPEHPEHQAAWIRVASKKNCRRLKVELQRAREGGAPRSGDGKGLPEVRYPHRVTLGAAPHRMQELAQAKLSAELGRPATAAELQELMLGLYLQMESEGKVPGWRYVPSSLYRIVLRPLILDEGAPLFVDTDDGPVRVDGSQEDDVLARQRGSCAACDGDVADDDEPGPGETKRKIDKPTPPGMRQRVLERDGHRCRCCGRRVELHAHHIDFRQDGGPTKMWNLIAICPRCHALVHEGLLRIEGKTQKKAVFVDGEGRPVHDASGRVDPDLLLQLSAPVVREPAAGSVSEDPAVPLTTLDTVPDEIDGDWWTRNAELLHPRRDGGLELRVGRPVLPVEGTGGEDGEEEEQAPEPVSFEEAFGEIVGQDALLETLDVEARGARARGRSFPHAVFMGPAGTGKTTLATGIARAFGARFHHGVGPDLGHVLDLVRLLAGLREHDVLFLDEIHAVPRKVLEMLYEAMAARKLSLTLRCGARARTVTLRLPAFTLLAATSEPAELPEPLLTRFVLREYLAEYEVTDLAEIASRAALREGLAIEAEAAERLARHARGRPREVRRLVERALNRARAEGLSRVDDTACRRTLRAVGFDAAGLLPEERRYLEELRGNRAPVPGVRLARMAGISVRRALEVVEPWLCRRGFVRVTPRGRVPGPRLVAMGPLAREGA